MTEEFKTPNILIIPPNEFPNGPKFGLDSTLTILNPEPASLSVQSWQKALNAMQDTWSLHFPRPIMFEFKFPHKHKTKWRNTCWVCRWIRKDFNQMRRQLGWRRALVEIGCNKKVAQ